MEIYFLCTILISSISPLVYLIRPVLAAGHFFRY